MKILEEKHNEIISGHFFIGNPWGQQQAHANLTIEQCIKFANWIRKEINEDRLRHYDPTENGKWAYWRRGGGGIAKQCTTRELFEIFNHLE